MVEIDRQTCMIYPNYIDSKASVSMGRKVPQEDCIETPTILEIAEATKRLGIKFDYQPDSCHPQSFLNPGRLIITLLDNAGEPVIRDIPDRKTYLYRVLMEIPSYREEMQRKEEALLAQKKAEDDAEAERQRLIAEKEAKDKKNNQKGKKKK